MKIKRCYLLVGLSEPECTRGSKRGRVSTKLYRRSGSMVCEQGYIACSATVFDAIVVSDLGR